MCPITHDRAGGVADPIMMGAILAGLSFTLLWQLPQGHTELFYFWFFLIGSLLFFLAYTVFATPWVALGYELTPGYHERTRLMGVQNFIGQTAYLISPWFLWFMELDRFDNLREGASELAILVALVCIIVGVLPAILLRERHAGSPQDVNTAFRSNWHRVLLEIVNFLNGFLQTLKSTEFLKLCGATFLVFNGFQLIGGFQTYVVIYYVFGGDRGEAVEYLGLFGAISAAATFAVVAFTAWLGTVIGKRQAFFLCISISIIGYGLKWWQMYATWMNSILVSGGKACTVRFSGGW